MLEEMSEELKVIFSGEKYDETLEEVLEVYVSEGKYDETPDEGLEEWEDLEARFSERR